MTNGSHTPLGDVYQNIIEEDDYEFLGECLKQLGHGGLVFILNNCIMQLLFHSKSRVLIG